MHKIALALCFSAGMVLSPANAGSGFTDESCLPPSLQTELAQIRNLFGPINVTSTHRPGAVVTGTDHASKHRFCRAVDFHPGRGKYRAVLKWLRANHTGGLGTYSGRYTHIHIDDGAGYRWHTHTPGTAKPRTRLAGH